MSSIEPFVHRKIVVLHDDASAQQAARAMCDRKIGCIVVSDHEGHVVGILTDRDIVCGLFAYGSDPNTKISDIMTPRPIVIRETAEVEDVIKIMETNGIRRVPVVHKLESHVKSGREKCVGIITLDDLIASQSVESGRLARVVQSQLFRRRSSITKDARGYRSQLRSEARADQTLNRFFNTVAEKARIDEDSAADLTEMMLSCIVQRMHYTGAAHLIAQLPHNLQDQLLDLPAGPDRSITLSSILNELSRHFGFDEKRAQEVASGFGDALRSLIAQGQFEHALAQLPDDIKCILTEKQEEPHKKVA